MAKKKLVTRTFSTTTIHCAEVKVVNGEVTTTPLEDIAVPDDISKNTVKQQKAVNRQYKGINAVPISTEVNSTTYGMTVELFLANAEEISGNDTFEEDEEVPNGVPTEE